MDKKRELAIAYEVKKRNSKKPKYAEGGIIESIGSWVDKQKADYEKVKEIDKGTYVDPKTKRPSPELRGYAKGGMVEAIMERRKQQRDSEQVDIQNNNREEPNSFYHLNEHEALEYNMNDAFEDIDQPVDSNLHDVEIDKDEHDMISQIRAKMNVKRQFRDK